ncbi:S8 family serine peptidase [Roseateles sp.]|uniref:S8 family serine peptidase n=1 Tax=Roseateles sp. TaxID=1971397 RepID=UPI0025DA76D0|nr:S8 family serine peptidase [Roseateles sp.]MBV8034558.1 S8 family serine peptidase [Roseateles sp.]
MKMILKPAALAALVLLSGVATSSLAQSRKTYIVQLKDEPAASYQGTVSGYAATQPAPGEAFQASSARVQAYLGYLNQKQGEVLSLIDRNQVLATYDTVFNGFSARLTEDEALALRNNGDVVDLFEDSPRQLDTISTSKFLGLSAPGGLWTQSINGSAIKGENLVIGVIDGGIWPENPAFFDKVDGNGIPSSTGTQVYGAPPASFTGGCTPGEGITAAHCNNKLVGIKYFKAGFNATGNTLHWTDFVSGRDSVAGPVGHGSHGDHTASTAAGNSGPSAIVSGLNLGAASGMAPRARIAAYKVCWTWVNPGATDGTGSQNNCWPTDSVAAIDAAVKDGVNVINFSISGSQTTVNDPVEQAFYRAALANVFVAASAGNSGPGQAVAHLSPWLSTIAASTHDRVFNGDVTLGNGAKYTGASMSQNSVPAGTALINASDAGLPGANATNLRLCYTAGDNGGTPVLDPAKVTGKIVVCDRGTNARVNKSAAVADAGGVGMVMADNGSGLVAEPHSVPTVHVTAADGAAIKAYAAGGAGTAAISTFYVGSTTNAPVMAGFSSRGPNAGDANLLKPDITAPGVDVIAQGTPDITQAERDQVVAGTLVPPPAWTTLSGTSMASPHVAGLGLLLRQAHPTWSPAAIKSALMTTAFSTLNDGLSGAQNGLLPWAQGAGHVAPQKATDPGLVYDAGKNDWVKYQCKVNKAAVSPASDCTTIGTLDETYNLNLPSITAGSVYTTGVTVTRRVTNVGNTSATYVASASVPNFTTVVTPSTLTLAVGETKSFTVKLTPNAAAAANTWYFGSLTWNDGAGHVVRSPVQARLGVPISAPTGMSGLTTSGTRTFTIKTGIAGRISARKGGMKDVTMSPSATLTPGVGLSSAQLATVCRAGTDTSNVKVYKFDVPANTIVARWALRQADTSGPMDDNDMLVVTPSNTTLYSGSEGSNEAVQISSPAAGSYTVCVHAYGGQPQMTHSLSSWVVTPSDTGGNFTVLVPSQVYAGSSATVGMSWSGLTNGKRYVGGAQWVDPNGAVQSATVLRVEPGVAVLSEALDTAPRKLAEVTEE